MNTSSCVPCGDCLPTSTPLAPCIGGELCEEVLFSECVGYQGPNLPSLDIVNGERLSSMLFKLNKAFNNLSPVALVSHTATATTATPMVVTYLGLGPVYQSTSGAVGSTTSITVGSTTGLSAGMLIEVVAGVGAFPPNTSVVSVDSGTTFTVSAAPSTALTGLTTVVRATGTDHQAFTISVIQNYPQSFTAFTGSAVKLSGIGTITI